MNRQPPPVFNDRNYELSLLRAKLSDTLTNLLHFSPALRPIIPFAGSFPLRARLTGRGRNETRQCLETRRL